MYSIIKVLINQSVFQRSQTIYLHKISGQTPLLDQYQVADEQMLSNSLLQMPIWKDGNIIDYSLVLKINLHVLEMLSAIQKHPFTSINYKCLLNEHKYSI